MKNSVPSVICGSLPKPQWLAEPEKIWSPWLVPESSLRVAQIDAMRLSVEDQERAGLSIIGDGEQTRQHFVTTFIEQLSGVDFKNKKTMRIRDRYDAAVPVVSSAIERTHSIFVEDAKILRTLTKKPIKYTLPGPMTLVDTLYDDHYGSREKLAWRFAEILNQEALELQAAGVNIIQFDEPAFNVFFDEVRDWGIATLERAAQDLTCTTGVHICYGYGIEANIKWKETLGNEWRQYENIFPLLSKSKINQVSLECQNSKVPIELIGLLQNKDVLVGAIDVATKIIETPDQVASVLRQASKHVPIKHIHACTNCGMVPLSRDVALAKINALTQGTHKFNQEV